MVDSLQAETAMQAAVSRDRKRAGAPGGRIPAAIAFLEAALAGGAVAVAELEVHARAAGLVGERQRVSDAKTFKAAKKKLGIISRRAGFGRDGEWSWGLPTIRTVKPAEMAADLAPKVPALVIYADHSRPVRSGVIGSALVRPSVAFQPPSHSSKPLSPVVP